MYYGYNVTILVANTSRTVTFSWFGLTYNVDWPTTQANGDRDLPVHKSQPTTVARTPGAVGMLFLKESYCNEPDVMLPLSLGVQFSQQAHYYVSGSVVTTGGRYGWMWIDQLAAYRWFDWTDRTQSWLGSPSNLPLDANGYPLGRCSGWLCVTGTQLVTIPAGSIKWPDGLAGPNKDHYFHATAFVASASGPQVHIVVTDNDSKPAKVYVSVHPILLNPAMTYPENRHALSSTTAGWKTPAVAGEPIVYPDPTVSTMPFNQVGVHGDLLLLKKWVNDNEKPGVFELAKKAHRDS